MHQFLKNLSILILLLSFSLSHSQELEKTPFSIGESIKFESKILKESRILNIYLPNGYKNDSTKTYPVIYLLDGSEDEDFIHISGLVQFMSFPWIATIPESIVVGIANVDRKRDFTFPSSNELDKDEFPTSGKSEKFMMFLKQEVKSLINSTYSTTDESTLIGQSLGGLLATEILLKHPDYFDNYIIISPSLWWDDQSILNISLEKIKPPKKIYVAVGKEGPTMEATSMTLIAKLQKLRKKKLEDTLIIDYNIFNNLDHANILHDAVYRGFIKFKERSNDSIKN